MILHGPDFITMPDLRLHYLFPSPSTPTILLALFILSLLLVLSLTLRPTLFPLLSHQKSLPCPAPADEKGQQHYRHQLQAVQNPPQNRGRRFWRLTWQSLPALPVSLSLADNPMSGVGVGLAPVHSYQVPRRASVAFDAPLPAVYQAEAPMSMAKMIMSRHTFRRPQPRTTQVLFHPKRTPATHNPSTPRLTHVPTPARTRSSTPTPHDTTTSRLQSMV